MLKNQFLIFVRGLPGSGKTTSSKYIQQILPETQVVNPDSISVNNNEFVKFRSKFENERLKIVKYRFNLQQAIDYLNEYKNVIWEQPWRKVKNIDLTIRNLYARLIENNENLWTEDISKVIQSFPLRILILETQLPEAIKKEHAFKKTIRARSKVEYISLYKPASSINSLNIITVKELNELKQILNI